jgi:hypothetical protein
MKDLMENPIKEFDEGFHEEVEGQRQDVVTKYECILVR